MLKLFAASCRQVMISSVFILSILGFVAALAMLPDSVKTINELTIKARLLQNK